MLRSEGHFGCVHTGCVWVSYVHVRHKSCVLNARTDCGFVRQYRAELEAVSQARNINNLLLIDINMLRDRILRNRQRKEWVGAMHVKREELGEFHHMWDDLRKDSKRFYGYLLMARDTFDYILSEVRCDLTKYNNFRKTISPEEGLVVTLR
ncbi:hypothetical protein PR048_014298 [Dryococelus australis]|uniref:Uncharacterized protein n=1 Tax=Dryococelus australis TaxID=614101 RepID=A0ABQ9HE16_9NEOP|nr:hypothetical protein PR048_014298 [Dryococelus australis]